MVKNGADFQILTLSEILYIEANDDYVKMHTHTGMFLKKQALSILENQFHSEQFVRIHRSYLLNFAVLMRIEPAEKANIQQYLKIKRNFHLVDRIICV